MTEEKKMSMAEKVMKQDSGEIIDLGINPENPIYEKYELNVLGDLESRDFGSWEAIKEHILGLQAQSNDLFFVSHKEDEIVGKPQGLYEVTKKIVLVTKAVKMIRDIDSGEFYPRSKTIFIDEPYDKRYSGAREENVGFQFWIYRLVEHGVEYMVLSEKELSPQQYRLRGMIIDLKDSSELNKTLSLKSISKLFITVENEPNIKPMSKEKLIPFVENLGLTKEEFIEYLYTHPSDNKVYSHSEQYSRIRIYQELSGKYQGYPLHLMIWGNVGRGKTIELECIDDKFNEDKGIYEAGAGTIKGIIPSWSVKPANQGHILKCVRRCLIDEMNKLIGKNKNYEDDKDNFGELNFLLEHKLREISSGNDNGIKAQATAKITLATNAHGTKRFLHEHVGVLDQSTMSRILHLVVDTEETDFVKKNRVKKISHNKISNDEWLSIYDSCQNFLVDYDEEKIRDICDKTMSASEKFRKVWEPRSLHHSVLLLDGIVKFRCLFSGNSGFNAIKEDYEELEKIINYLMSSWTYSLKS